MIKKGQEGDVEDEKGRVIKEGGVEKSGKGQKKRWVKEWMAHRC